MYFCAYQYIQNLKEIIMQKRNRMTSNRQTYAPLPAILLLFTALSFASASLSMEKKINLVPIEGAIEKIELPFSIAIQAKIIQEMIEDLGGIQALDEQMLKEGIPLNVDA